MTNHLTYKDYIGTVEFSAEDEVFYGSLFGIQDLVTFEGKSVKDLKNSFKEAVNDYLASCQQIGKEPNKTFKGSFNVRVNQQLHKQAALTAAKFEISLNDLVKRAIAYAVNNEKVIRE